VVIRDPFFVGSKETADEEKKTVMDELGGGREAGLGQNLKIGLFRPHHCR
jgi:hypothetical protein